MTVAMTPLTCSKADKRLTAAMCCHSDEACLKRNVNKLVN